MTVWRALMVAIVVGVCPRADAAPQDDVARELRTLADRVARHVSPPGLGPLVEERAAAGDLAGLADVLRGRHPKAPTMGAVGDGWLAHAWGAAGDRAEVDRLAKQVDDALAKAADDRLAGSASCGVAMAYEYLRDHAAADRWRKRATAAQDWCTDTLPVVAARNADHDRALALIAEQTAPDRRGRILIDVAAAYAGTDNTRALKLLDEATKHAEHTQRPVMTWAKLAVTWAAAGRRDKARAAAKQALELLDNAAGDADGGALVVFGREVADALAAAGETKPLAALVRRLEKIRTPDDRFVARVQTARVVAKYGAKARGKRLVAAAAKELESVDGPELRAAARFALIDAYLALGDIVAAIDQAERISITQPIEIDGLLAIGRHCRLRGCARTTAVAKALADVAARLDKLDARRR